MVDRRNAHVRGQAPGTQAPQQTPQVAAKHVAEDAKRLLNDPAFQRGFNGVRDALVHEIEGLKHDGSEAKDNYLLEVCRSLRALHAMKRAIALTVQGETLRQADFRTQNPPNEEG